MGTFPSLVLFVLCVVACIGWVRYACRASDTQDRLEYAESAVCSARKARDYYIKCWDESDEKLRKETVAKEILELEVEAQRAELGDAVEAKKLAQEEARAANAVRTHYYHLMQESAEFAQRLVVRLLRIRERGAMWNVVDLEVRRMYVRQLGIELAGRDDWSGPWPIGVGDTGEVTYTYTRVHARKLLGVS